MPCSKFCVFWICWYPLSTHKKNTNPYFFLFPTPPEFGISRRVVVRLKIIRKKLRRRTYFEARRKASYHIVLVPLTRTDHISYIQPNFTSFLPKAGDARRVIYIIILKYDQSSSANCGV